METQREGSDKDMEAESPEAKEHRGLLGAPQAKREAGDWYVLPRSLQKKPTLRTP